MDLLIYFEEHSRESVSSGQENKGHSTPQRAAQQRCNYSSTTHGGLFRCSHARRSLCCGFKFWW